MVQGGERSGDHTAIKQLLSGLTHNAKIEVSQKICKIDFPTLSASLLDAVVEQTSAVIFARRDEPTHGTQTGQARMGLFDKLTHAC